MSYEIQGRTVTLPVRVRDADSWSVQWMVDVDAARAMLDGTGLEPAEPRPGKAMVTILFVVYRDSDLDRYNECGIGVFVRPHDAGPASALAKAAEVARGRAGVFIKHLPVTQTFTLEAGRAIWGFPKFLADIGIERRNGLLECTVRHEGRDLLTMDIREGGPIPLPARAAPTYTHLDGTLRLTRWKMRADARRARPGGAHLTLGDHPIADELRALDLPATPLLSATFRGFRAIFGPAEVVQSPVAASHA